MMDLRRVRSGAGAVVAVLLVAFLLGMLAAPAGAVARASSTSAASVTGGTSDNDNDSGDDDCDPPGDDDSGARTGSRDDDSGHGGSRDDDDADHDDDDDCEPDPCDDYLPRNLAISVPSPVPGQTVVISGTGAPNATVTITVARQGNPPIITTTTVAGPSGAFSKSVTIPSTAKPGIYRVQAVSPPCPTPAVLSFTLRYADNRCTAYKEIYVHRSWNVTWKLLGVFNFSKPVKVTLIPEAGGTSRQVFNAKPPSNKNITFKVQNSWATGWYTIQEVGTAPTGSASRTAECGRMLILSDDDHDRDGEYQQILNTLLISSTAPPARPSGSSFPAGRVALVAGIALVAVNSVRLVTGRGRYRRST